MSSLQQQLEESTTALQQAWTKVKTSPVGASLPTKCYEHWSKRTAMHQLLTGTLSLISVRNVAWDNVQQVSHSVAINGSTSIVTYNNIEMEFAIARHLALTSYVSVAWSIYDRLANVCGRLGGTTDFADNPKQNPKVCEDFLGKKDIFGFSGHLHIREAYAWPLKVSYKVRNWLVHEGYQDGNIPLFAGDSISDQFNLHADAIQYIQKSCGGEDDGRKRGNATCVAEAEDFWNGSDLLQILEQYNGEIDAMFAALLRWSIESFTGQIKAFASRDHI